VRCVSRIAATHWRPEAPETHRLAPTRGIPPACICLKKAGAILRESHDPIHSTWRVSLGLSSGLKPSDMKLATAVFVLATLALPAFGRRGAARETIRV
jgi:hypothetical protein